MTLTITPGRLRLDELRRVWQAPEPVALAADAWTAIEASSQAIERIVARGDAAYGVNTGFGLLAKKRIPDAELQQLQRNLILSHSVGTGELLSDDVVRLALVMKIASLARGHSGVRPLIVEALIALVNAGIVPCIPSKGSVGASGDLAPLSHLTLALLGEGEVRVNGATQPARTALAAAGIAPVVLGAKEGPCADQRHADFHRAGAARPVHGRARVRSRGGGRRDGDRRRQGQRRAVRSAAA